MSEIKPIQGADLNIATTFNSDQKLDAMVDIKAIPLPPEYSNEDHNIANNMSRKTSRVDLSSLPRKVSLPSGGDNLLRQDQFSSHHQSYQNGIDGETGEFLNGDEQLAQMRLRLEKLEAILQEKLGLTSDHRDGSQLEDAQDNTLLEVNEVDEPFSVEHQIKYIPSESWCLSHIRPLWTRNTGQHTLVVSRKKKPDIADDATTATVVKDNEHDRGRITDRMAIVCPVLLAEIVRITGASLTPMRNVLIPPFKILLSFQKEYVDCLAENEALCKILAEQNETETFQLGSPNRDDIESCGVSGIQNSALKHAQKVVNGMKCLLHFLDTHWAQTIEVRRQISEHSLKEIAFDRLWHLFKPGDIVVASKPKYQAYRVLHIGGGRVYRDSIFDKANPNSNGGRIVSNFFLDCYSFDYNGVHYGAVPKQVTITPYDGLRKITSLEVVPIEFLEGSKVEEYLVARGKKFAKLVKVAHKRYKGHNLKEGNFRPEELNGDTIIDFTLAFKNSNPPIEPPNFGTGVIETPTEPDLREVEETYQACPVAGHCERSYIYDDSEFDLARRTQAVDRYSSSFAALVADENNLSKRQLMLLPYRVYGYALLRRKWYPLDIDLIEDVKETENGTLDGFSDLVLPEDHKEIVRALVKTHARGTRSTSSSKEEPISYSRNLDVVTGKGKGLIILLHGVPGVGKTSTAECVAANTNRPLFPITCGDIGGSTAKEVEDNLESYFDLARKWGCVLLLDEADVFLGERLKGDIVQNSLVSVFLRVLEYYSGILILTTNRVGQFDEAIKSRIHISLYYPPLTKKTSLEIWKMNLDRLERQENENTSCRPVIFSRKDIMKFAKAHWVENQASKTNWNGRQIKNAFQTAIALAEWDHLDSHSNPRLRNDLHGPLLEANHFRKVAEASARFDQYLTHVRNSDEHNARVRQNRKDDFVDRGVPTEAGLHFPDLNETRRGVKVKKGHGFSTDSDDDQDESSSDSDSGDENFKAQKLNMDAIRILKEEEQRKREEAERLAKRKQKEQKKREQREREEIKRREELIRAREVGRYDSDTSDEISQNTVGRY